MSSNIYTYYEPASKKYTVYLVKPYYECVTKEGEGIAFELTKDEADALCTAIQFEPQVCSAGAAANSTENYYNEHAMYDDKQQTGKDSQP